MHLVKLSSATETPPSLPIAIANSPRGLAVDPVVVQVLVPGGSIARGSSPQAEVVNVLRQLVLGARRGNMIFNIT